MSSLCRSLGNEKNSNTAQAEAAFIAHSIFFFFTVSLDFLWSPHV